MMHEQKQLKHSIKRSVANKKILPELSKKLRKMIGETKWKHTVSEEYKDIPHEYFTLFQNRRLFNALKKCISIYGRYEWFKYGNRKPTKNKYLNFGRYRYWINWPILNRTKRAYIYYKNGISMQKKPR